ncbi:MAG: CoA-binding protein [Chitinophagales bacterium]
MTREKKLTVVLGASTNPSRYSYLAINRLVQHGHQVLPIGSREGEVAGVKIVTGTPSIEKVDTVTLYLNPQRQVQYYDYIINLQPKRIIFNPGTENSELEKLANENGIEATEACTLVMLSTGEY